MKQLINTIIILAVVYTSHNLEAQIEQKKILIVVTNHNKYNTLDKPTGSWLGEVTHFYHVLEKAGYTMDIVSPKGGKMPIDPKSYKIKGVNKKLMDDTVFVAKINNTLNPYQVNANDYLAIYYTGGHGGMWDFPNDSMLINISERIYDNKGAVTAVCHGVSGILNIKDASDNHIINGKKVSGFSNFEEKLIKLEEEVPFLLEDELVKRGGNYKKGILPFVSKTVTDGRLITGQNPASAKGVAKSLVKWLKMYKLENVLHPEDKEKIISRINNLSLSSEKKWGKMTVEQMICHLLDQVNIALGKIPTEQQGNFIIRSFIGEAAALNKKPWKPEKYEAPKEMNQEKEGSQPSGNFENDKRKLINILNEFVNTPEEKLSKHPLFGKMSKKKWGRIIWKNFDHHLRQFSE